MKEYIERTYIADRMDYHLSNSNGSEHYAYEICKNEIADAPTADVVELKHGTWIPITKQHGNETDGFWTERYLQCSVCGYERLYLRLRENKPNYCESCIAKMDLNT